jgi:hypothetical protein
LEKKVNGIKNMIIIRGATFSSIPKYPTNIVNRINPITNCIIYTKTVFKLFFKLMGLLKTNFTLRIDTKNIPEQYDMTYAI